MWTARGRDPFLLDYRLQLDANDDTNAAMVENDPGLVSHFTWPGTTVAPCQKKMPLLPLKDHGARYQPSGMSTKSPVLKEGNVKMLSTGLGLHRSRPRIMVLSEGLLQW